MKSDVKKYGESCEVCQINKAESPSPTELLQPLPILERILEDWTMDFIQGLLKAKGFDSIMVVVDTLSKFGHFVPLKHPFTTKQVTEVFNERVVSKHRLLKSLITNRDKIFLSHFWKALFTAMGIVLKRSIAFHPQTDRQTKRVNNCLETFLRRFLQ